MLNTKCTFDSLLKFILEKCATEAWLWISEAGHYNAVGASMCWECLVKEIKERNTGKLHNFKTEELGAFKFPSIHQIFFAEWCSASNTWTCRKIGGKSAYK